MCAPRLLLHLGALSALTLAACSSVDLPFVGESEGETASTPAWIQDGGQNAAAAAVAPQGEDTAAPASFAEGESAAGAIVTGFAATPAFGEDFPARLAGLESATAALAAELRTLNGRCAELAAAQIAGKDESAAMQAALGELADGFAGFSGTFSGIETRLDGLAANAASHAKAIEATRSDLRNVPAATEAAVTAAVEGGIQRTSRWFQITLAALIAGFAFTAFFLWRRAGRTDAGYGSNR